MDRLIIDWCPRSCSIIFCGNALDLWSYGILHTRLIRKFYEPLECSVIFDHTISKWLPVRSGGCQGCILPRILFQTVIDWIISRTAWRSWIHRLTNPASTHIHKLLQTISHFKLLFTLLFTWDIQHSIGKASNIHCKTPVPPALKQRSHGQADSTFWSWVMVNNQMQLEQKQFIPQCLSAKDLLYILAQ